MLNDVTTLPQHTHHPLDPLKVLDWPLAVQQAGNQEPLARELLQLLLQFLPQITTQIEQIVQGLTRCDPLQLIHKLHGGCLYSGVPRLCALCRTLESALRKGYPIDRLMPEWLELLDEIDNVQQAAQQQLADEHKELSTETTALF